MLLNLKLGILSGFRTQSYHRVSIRTDLKEIRDNFRKQLILNNI